MLLAKQKDFSMETRFSDRLAQVRLPAGQILTQLSPQTLQCGPTGLRTCFYLQCQIVFNPWHYGLILAYAWIESLEVPCLDHNETEDKEEEGEEEEEKEEEVEEE